MAALIHIPRIPAKLSLGLFSSALVLGSGAAFATSLSSPSKHSDLQQASTVTNQTNVAIPVSTNTETSASTTESNNSDTTASTNVPNNTATNNSNVRTEVTVNGDKVNVQPNSTVHRTITNDNGSTTTVDVSTQTSAQNSTNTYTNVQTNSFVGGATTSIVNQSGVHN